MEFEQQLLHLKTEADTLRRQLNVTEMTLRNKDDVTQQVRAVASYVFNCSLPVYSPHLFMSIFMNYQKLEYIYFSYIYIYYELCTGNNCVTKTFFSQRVEMYNNGILLLFYLLFTRLLHFTTSCM